MFKKNIIFYSDFILIRVRSLETEVSQLGDANADLVAAKRKVEVERDELVEELAGKPGFPTEEKKRYEDQIEALMEELEEERGNVEVTNDKLKKTQLQVNFLLYYAWNAVSLLLRFVAESSALLLNFLILLSKV